MADGTFAVLWLLLGLTDPVGCGGGHCAPDVPRLAVSGGEVLERRADAVSELYLRYDPGLQIGPYRPAAGLSIAGDGALWIGLGSVYAIPFAGRRFYVELHFMPGLHIPNGGFDLGGPIVFRSGIEIGYQDAEGWRYGLAYDHRSHGGLFDRNPGMETVQYRVGLPMR